MGKRIVERTSHCVTHYDTDWQEYRVSYRGLKKDRAEAMAYYTNDKEDAVLTMGEMEARHLKSVGRSDIADWKYWTEYRE